jgi:lipopolysaccharide/colanic/teichoic acid biosynthesis glycosyltransferase
MAARRNVATAGQTTWSVRSDPFTRLIVLRRTDDGQPGATLLEYALSTAPLRDVVLEALYRGPRRADGGGQAATTMWAMPHEWPMTLPAELGQKIPCEDVVPIDAAILRKASRHRWFVISNGRFVAQMNGRLFEQALGGERVDAAAVMIDPQLTAYRERIRLTQQGRLVGYRRLYQDSAEPILVPADWPHHLFLSGRIAEDVLSEGLPARFQSLMQRLRSRQLGLRTLAVAGRCLDLDTQDGLLSLIRMALDGAFAGAGRQVEAVWHATPPDGDCQISPQSRFVGPVLLGRGVCVEPDAVVVGPSVLCDNSRVHRGGVVDASIVGTDGEVAADAVVRNTILAARPLATIRRPAEGEPDRRPAYSRSEDTFAFRSWGRLSYAGCFKRIADIVAAVIVLVLFAPIIPLIAVAIKINSPGPVFFKHKRQGFHGKPFSCVKFRTMIAGADTLQDFLRFISEVDGPQFKVTDDPRITTVGRFLRETFLDEIPQFYNVLMGDMSVVGPRPSPEPENTLCPWWRDARLSVRPGITGLWQISRTRKPLKDFQEWIHYDTQYVRQLSMRLDLWICWRTFRKMVGDFIRHF